MVCLDMFITEEMPKIFTIYYFSFLDFCELISLLT